MLLNHLAAAVVAAVPSAVVNPFDGVTPSMDVFGVTFSGKVQLILGGLWAVVLVGIAGAVLVGAGKWGWNTRVTHSSEGVMESAGQFKTALISFGVAAGISIVIGGILFVVQG